MTRTAAISSHFVRKDSSIAANGPGNTSESEFAVLVRAACDSSELAQFPVQPQWACDLREMLDYLSRCKFGDAPTSPLHAIVRTGGAYGLITLEASVAPKVLELLSPKAKISLCKDLERRLRQITQPSFKLTFGALSSALDSISLNPATVLPEQTERTFLSWSLYYWFAFLFRHFPVLARLWSELISQWRDAAEELLFRFKQDQAVLSQTLFARQPLGKIIDLRLGLSDPHNGGRTVTSLHFNAGCVIYKPRPGVGEREWERLVYWLNEGFRPRLRAARVLCRSSYCWMEEIAPINCRSEKGVRLFYKRLGATIAVAYLLEAADFHRDNMIASGEWPILIDLETLSHPTPRSEGSSIADSLYRTGFFQLGLGKNRSQPESSVLGKSNGRHKPKIGRRVRHATEYNAELVRGFELMWRRILGGQRQRAAFVRRVQRIRRQLLRRIYATTIDYDMIRWASIQPTALRSQEARGSIIRQMSERGAISKSILQAEISALQRLDIPRFNQRLSPLLVARRGGPPKELANEVRKAFRV
jgi:hypothetical protein